MSDSSVLCAQMHSYDNDPIRLFHAADKLTKRSNLADRWLIDSGVSRTMSLNWDWFLAYSLLDPPHKIWLGDNTYIQALGVGRIPIHMRADHKWNRAILQDILYIPELYGNLLSVSALAQCGAQVKFAPKTCEIQDKDNILTCIGHIEGNLYILDARTYVRDPTHIAQVNVPKLDEDFCNGHEMALRTHAQAATTNTSLRHHPLDRLGHLNAANTARKGTVDDTTIARDATHEALGTYEPCTKGTHARQAIKNRTDTRADAILGRAHSDTCGPIPTRSREGYAQNRRAHRLAHRPSGRIVESHDVIFDEGGEQNHSERIIIDHDVDLNSHSGGVTPSNPRPDKTNPEQVVRSPAAAQPPLADAQRSKAASTPTLAPNRPSHIVSSHTRKPPATRVTASNPTPDAGEHTHDARVLPKTNRLTTEDLRSQAALEERRRNDEADPNDALATHHSNASKGEQSIFSKEVRPVNSRKWIFGTIHTTELAKRSRPCPCKDHDPARSSNDGATEQACPFDADRTLCDYEAHA